MLWSDRYSIYSVSNYNPPPPQPPSESQPQPPRLPPPYSHRPPGPPPMGESWYSAMSATHVCCSLANLYRGRFAPDLFPFISSPPLPSLSPFLSASCYRHASSSSSSPWSPAPRPPPPADDAPKTTSSSPGHAWGRQVSSTAHVPQQHAVLLLLFEDIQCIYSIYIYMYIYSLLVCTTCM